MRTFAKFLETACRDRATAVDAVATAYHEAGHAVIAHVLGFKVTSVSVGLKNPTIGKCVTERTTVDALAQMLPESRRLLVERHIIWSLAGAMAERVFSGADSDGGAAEDRTGEQRMLHAITQDSVEAQALLSLLEIRAERLVAKWRDGIARVAQYLLMRGRLTGDEIEHILVLGYAPPRRRPKRRPHVPGVLAADLGEAEPSRALMPALNSNDQQL
jgi:ATP-dependent Zn protease